MNSENRRFPRVEVRSGQLIAYHSFLPPGNCMVLDYGLGGARCLLQTRAMNEIAARSWIAALELGASLELELVSISKKRIRASVRHARMISEDLAVFGLQFRHDDVEANATLDCGLRVFAGQGQGGLSPANPAVTETAKLKPEALDAPASAPSGPQAWPAVNGELSRSSAADALANAAPHPSAHSTSLLPAVQGMPPPAPETTSTQSLASNEAGDSHKSIALETTRVLPVVGAPRATRPMRKPRFGTRLRTFVGRIFRRQPAQPDFRQLRLGEILIHFYETDAAQVNELMQRAQRNNLRLGELLLKERIVTRQELLNMLVLQSGLPCVRLSLQNSGRLRQYLSAKDCKKYNVAPFNYKENTLYVACTERLTQDAIEQLEAASRCKIKLFVTSDHEMQMFLAAR